MFDFDVGKLLLIGVVALIFIPPRDLPGALRQLGRVLGHARRMATDFRAQFDEALRETDMHDLKDEFADLKQKTSIEGTMNRIADMIDPEKTPPQETPPQPPENHMIEQADLPPPDVKPEAKS